MSQTPESPAGRRPSRSPELDSAYVEATGGKRSTPDRRLLVAILRRALWDFAQYKDPDSSNHQLHIDAAGWLFWDGQEQLDEEGRMTYHFICEVLDLDPRRVREGAKALTRDRIRRISQRIEMDDG